MTIKNILSIAGSDPSGGAGIQADLKTFSALGAYGMAAITALTAQNTMGVSDVFVVPHDVLKKQLTALVADVRIDGVKIGMVGNRKSAEIIGQFLEDACESYKAESGKSLPIVVDPVYSATSGNRLVNDRAMEALEGHLFPHANLITPNIPEAEFLLGASLAEDFGGDPVAMVQALNMRFLVPVLLKGGHGSRETCLDVYAQGGKIKKYDTNRIETKNTHGTGCTLSSAITVFLAQGLEITEAIEKAKAYITAAIAQSGQLTVGRGHGPVHHFHTLWTETL